MFACRPNLFWAYEGWGLWEPYEAWGAYKGWRLWETYEGWARHKKHKFKKRTLRLRFLNLGILF